MRPSRRPLPASFETDSIVLVDRSRAARVVADHLVSPNGTVLAPDGSYLVVAETYAQRLTRFDRSADGSLSNRRLFAEVLGSYPDGICLDDDGAVWFGSPYTDEFVRVLDGGEVTDRIRLPGAVACILGGGGRRTLFLLGVSSVPPIAERAEHAPPPTAPTGALWRGHIWTAPAATPGVGWP